MGLATTHRHVKKNVFSKLYEQVCVGQGKNVVHDNTNHRGARVVFLIMNSFDILKRVSVLIGITVDFVEVL